MTLFALSAEVEHYICHFSFRFVRNYQVKLEFSLTHKLSDIQNVDRIWNNLMHSLSRLSYPIFHIKLRIYI